MTSVRGTYYDGRSWRRREVDLTLAAGGALQIHGDTVDQGFAFAEVRVSRRLGDIPRYLYLPGGAVCEVHDNMQVDAWLQTLNAHRPSRLLHRLDNSILATLAAIVLVGALAASFTLWGAPAVAERAVAALPMSMDEEIGQDSLVLLDRVLFSESTVAASRQATIRAAFDTMVADMRAPMGGELMFRNGKRLGANALALAGNTIVITDQLIALAEHDEEIIAVLAHEMGHIRHRHVMKHLARTAIGAVLWATILGDVTAVTGVAATMPGVLDSLRHSRAFEREADQVALSYLDSVGIEPARLGDLLSRMAAGCPDCEEPPRYLSTHPPLSERVAALSAPAER